VYIHFRKGSRKVAEFIRSPVTCLGVGERTLAAQIIVLDSITTMSSKTDQIAGICRAWRAVDPIDIIQIISIPSLGSTFSRTFTKKKELVYAFETRGAVDNERLTP
jgi:hypothetical protein